jgi:hypothetical protein
VEYEERAQVVGEVVGGSGRLDLGHLLVDLVICVIASARQDQRDRFGRLLIAAWCGVE